MIFPSANGPDDGGRPRVPFYSVFAREKEKKGDLVLRLKPVLGMILALVVIFLFAGCEKKEPTPRMIKIGMVNLTPTLDDMVQGFKQGMSELGYVEGQTVEYIYDGPSGTAEASTPQIRRILAQNVDLIFSLTTPVTSRVKEALGGRKIPVIFAPLIDPVKSGFVNSLREPGGQMTGVVVTTTTFKGLEWLREIIPDLKRIYVPVNPEDQAMGFTLSQIKEAAKAHAIEVVVAQAVTPEEVKSVLENIPPDIQAIWEMPSGFWAPYLELFLSAQIKHKKVLMASNLVWAKMGAVMSIGSNTEIVGKQASRMADKILRGTPPSLIPVERTDVSLYLNLNSAEIIGVEIPLEVLKKAQKIYR